MTTIKELGQTRRFTAPQIDALVEAKVIRFCADCKGYHTTSLGWKKIDEALG